MSLDSVKADGKQMFGLVSLNFHRKCRAAGRGARGNISSVSFLRKLIVHRFLCLKLFCSSKIVDFRDYFVKFVAMQPFFPLGLTFL